MKLILWDWLCPTHGPFEELAKSDIRQLPCPQCGRTSDRQISAPRINLSEMALSSSASPESISHFERIHRERRAIEDKHYSRNGDYGPDAGSDGGKGFHVPSESDFV